MERSFLLMMLVGVIASPMVFVSRGLPLDGDTIENAIPITDPYGSYSGSTVGYTDDYDEACPYPGSTAPDVVYVLEAPGAGWLDISLCNSLYDTKVYVYEFANGFGFGNPLACNDDAGCGYSGYQSLIESAPISIGHTYYIVVDGYGASSGDYTLDLLWV